MKLLHSVYLMYELKSILAPFSAFFSPSLPSLLLFLSVSTHSKEEEEGTFERALYSLPFFFFFFFLYSSATIFSAATALSTLGEKKDRGGGGRGRPINYSRMAIGKRMGRREREKDREAKRLTRRKERRDTSSPTYSWLPSSLLELSTVETC